MHSKLIYNIVEAYIEQLSGEKGKAFSDRSQVWISLQIANKAHDKEIGIIIICIISVIAYCEGLDLC
jgi:hypothetical protein